jgi:hypothetical protein
VWTASADEAAKGPAVTAASNAGGNGNGTGKPGPGEVGRADDKSPPGQSQGDKNKGYECDDNKGVGQGNPAHTSNCSTNNPVNPASGPGEPGTTTTTTVTPTPTVQPVTPPSAEVLGETETRPPAVTAPTQLAFTGTGTAQLLTALGLALTLLGLVMVFAARSTATE